MMPRRDRRVLAALQALLLALPLFLGGHQPLAVFAAGVLVVALLVVTARARREASDAPHAPGVAALGAFVVLALATTLPLPPALLSALSPALARLTAALLPGWPDGGGWSVWRPLAMDSYGVTTELVRIAIGLGAFAVIVAYPWRSEGYGRDAHRDVFGRLLLTVISGGVLLAALALVEQFAGNGRVLWISDAAAEDGRASGSFVNPNHLAAWLEMILPVTLAYGFALTARLRRRLARIAHAGRGMGVHARRAWISAIIAQQERLWPPLAAAAAGALMLVAHVATGSRGGAAALLAGIAIATAGAANSTRRSGDRARWLPLALASALVVAALGSLVLWARVDDDETRLASADVSLASRVVVGVAGTAIVRDHPVFGTGLGSWLHAFRPHQEPPVPGGIWDHAHDDYLELAAETGAAGVILALLFVFAVARAARGEQSRRERPGSAIATLAAASETDHALAAGTLADGDALPAPTAAHARDERASTRGFATPPGFAASEWWAALDERTLLRFGLLGGVTAIVVHSFVDFGLRLPANLLLLMTVLALLVVSGRRRAAASSRAVVVLAATIAVALVPQLMNTTRRLTGASPIASRDCLDAADLRLAEEGDTGRDAAVALVQRALDGNPFDREAHEALASTLEPGPDAEAALRRALVLEPWSSEVRDRLALALWTRGERVAALTELEDSMRRLPGLAAHAYLSPETRLATHEPAQLLRSLTDGDTVQLRVAGLVPELAGAVEHGLTRALDDAAAGPDRTAVVDDLATLLEVRERWADAAALLHDEAAHRADGSAFLARAAHDYLRAHADRPAEETLLAALVQDPDQGDLYRKLAVDVYAARGEFKTADIVLAAAQRNAVDLLSVYRGVSEVITQRDRARVDEVPDPIAEAHVVDAALPSLVGDTQATGPVPPTVVGATIESATGSRAPEEAP
jgi:O-antigen ligase/tetratricopeptide (TPR) repeat protein